MASTNSLSLEEVTINYFQVIVTCKVIVTSIFQEKSTSKPAYQCHVLSQCIVKASYADPIHVQTTMAIFRQRHCYFGLPQDNIVLNALETTTRNHMPQFSLLRAWLLTVIYRSKMIFYEWISD